jgi:hypothetical protein
MSVFDTSKTTTTTLPSWFSTAQQAIGTAAPTVYGAATDPSKTVASGLVSDLNSQTANPFTTAISGLQTAQNANLNPFLSTGGPDTSTPLGALFASQNARLDQLLPQITSQVGAGGIGTGNYNSLRGQTATETARAGALTSLNEQQNKALMDAMGQSIQAGSVLGNVGSQYGTTALNTANLEMMGGLPALSKYSDIINAMGPSADRTASETTKGSSYENLLKTLNAAGSAGMAWDKISSGKTGLGWLDKILTSNDVGTIFPGLDSSYNTEGAVQGGEFGGA